MKTSCPHCNHKYDFSKTPLGEKVKCSWCNSSFVLPHSMSILKKDPLRTQEISQAVAASILSARRQLSQPREAKLGKILSEAFMVGSLLLAFALAATAVICTFYNKILFQVGIILALAACSIILIPIVISLRDISRKLKK